MWGGEIFYLGNTINRVECVYEIREREDTLKKYECIRKSFLLCSDALIRKFHTFCMIFPHFSLICVIWGFGVEVERTALFLNLQNMIGGF